VFGAPPLDGLGTAGGFKVVIEDRGDTGMKSLQQVADGVVTWQPRARAEGNVHQFSSQYSVAVFEHQPDPAKAMGSR